jgi:glyceraldehyde 3-phosphate dehydrogenase
MINIAINGFGRIGRQAFKIALTNKNIKIVAINDLTSTQVLAHLLKYDTVYGRYDKEVTCDEKSIIVGGKKYPVLAEKDPSLLPWAKMNVDVVLECTGRFTDKEGAGMHLKAGAKKVVISAPAKGGEIPTFVKGVNEQKVDDESVNIINNASCTTNCISPVMAILEEKFGIEKAMMTTIHAITAEQNLVDGPPPGGKSTDLRRARAAGFNIIPTTTGAAIATTEVIPSLKNKFDGLSLRVPIMTGSLSDITAVLKKEVTKEEVNKALTDASKTKRFEGVLEVTNDPIVSSDIIGNSHSAIADLSLTNVVGGNLVKVVAWYDNEFGYAHRLVEMAVNYGIE